MIRKTLLPALGGAGGIALMVELGGAAHLPLVLVPFTTSIVLVMAAPRADFARPRNVVLGHFLSALAGLLVVTLFGDAPIWSALAVGTAIAAMQATDTMHPPAGINAFIMVTSHPSWTFLLVPVTLGAGVLVTYAFVFNKAADALHHAYVAAMSRRRRLRSDVNTRA